MIIRAAQGAASPPFPWLWVLPVVVITLFPFLPVLKNGFVNWDDLVNIVDNPNYRGLGWSQLKWMFSTFHLSLYRPVTWMTFGLDYLIWNMNPLGYHLTSLLFHAANAALFFLVALRLLRLAPFLQSAGELSLRLGAALAALFFSLHPLRVEAVAWASARNDVVSALLILLTVYCYLRAVSAPVAPPARRRWLGAALTAYAISLLAKSAGMTLPVVLLLLDIYPLRRISTSQKWFTKDHSAVLREKIPFFLFSLGAGIVAILAKQEGQIFHGLERHGFLVRLAESFYGLTFYLWKTIAPVGLSPLYQRAMEPEPFAWPFIGSAILVLLATIFLCRCARRWPAFWACWICYVITLIPVLGIVQFGHQVAADRYSYLSSLGWALLLGACFTGLWERWKPSAVLAAAVVVLAVLGALTWRQTKIWHDSERLWRHALSIDAASTIANHNLATEMKRQGNLDYALELYHKVIDIDPRFAQAHHDLGEIKAQQGDFQQAVEHYRNALKVDPRSAVTYHHLGVAFAAQQQFDDAIKNLERALRMNPDNPMAHNDLGNVMAARGDLEQAARHFRRAAELDPRAPEPYLNLGNLLLHQNKLEEAGAFYQQALRTDPGYAQAHFFLGRVRAAQAKLEEAAVHFRNAVRAQPSHVEAHRSLVQVLMDQGKYDEAKRQYDMARKLLGSQRDPGQ